MRPKLRPYPTSVVRMTRDLAVKLHAVCRFEDVDAADFIDPVVRKFIERKFAELPADFQRKVLAKAGIVGTPG